MKYTFFRSFLSALLLLVVTATAASPAFAAPLTGRSDIMTRQAPNVGSDHEIRFVTPSGVDAPTDTITLQFASDFDVSLITPADIDLFHGAITGLENSEVIGAAAAAGTWGASVSGQTITLTAPTDAVLGEIAATDIVIIRIGLNAGGANQIINPGPGTGGDPRNLWIAGTFGDTGVIEIPFGDPTNNDVIGVTATVNNSTPGGGGGGGGGCVGLACGDVLGPVITNIRVVNITTSTAMVMWDTNEPSTTALYHGLDTSYALGFNGNGAFVTSHSVLLTGLTQDTIYHFRINAADGLGNTSVSGDNTFETLAPGEPVENLIISNVQAILITDSTAAIIWDTNLPSNSRVDYGISDAYGDISVVGTFVTGHLVNLSNLNPDTIYHFRVMSETASTTAMSGDFTFRTTVDVIAPSNPLNFTAVPGQYLNLLSWNNPLDADFSHVRILARTDRYPNNPNDGVLVYQGNGQSATHSGLTPGQIYYYTNFAYDGRGNRSSGALAQATPFGEEIETPTSTPPVLPPVVTPPATTTPPVIEPPTSTQPTTTTPPVVPTSTEPGTVTTTTPPVQPPIRNVVITPEYTVGNGTVSLIPDENNQINTVPGPTVTVRVPASQVPGTPDTAVIRVGDDRYLLTRQPNGDWIASFVPDRSGEMPAEVTFGYGDGSIARATTTVSVGIPGQIIVRDIPFIGQARPVENATVTVYEKVNGAWRIWSGTATNQVNPRITTSDGVWGFVVPNGEYRVTIEKEGFDTEERVVTVTNNLLGSQIELRQPLPVDLTTVGLIATAVTIANIATLASVLNYLWYLLTQPFMIIGARKRKKWGVAYNAITKQGIDLVAVRLIHVQTGLVIQTRITDDKGRFFFHVKKGQYRIEAVKAGYLFPSETTKGKKEDDDYLDVYHGQPIDVEAESDLTPNIPLDPNNNEIPPKKVLFKDFLRKVQNLIGALSLIITVVAFALQPGWILFGLCLFQLATFLIFRRLIANRKPKNWGIVSEVDSKKPLERVVVRIFDKKYNKLLETQVTDSRGRYGFLASKNEYFVTADKVGYERFKSEDIDLTKTKEQAIERPIKLVKSK